MKASEIIYNIQNLRQKGIQTDTNDLSDAQILFNIDYYRAKLLKQQLDAKQIIGNSYYQDLGMLELIKSNEIESNLSCRFPIHIEKCILRTKKEIPNLFEHNGEYLINYLGTHDFSNAYTETTYNKLIWDLKSKYTSNTPKYFYLDKYIYVYNTNTNLKYIRTIGIFENSLETELFKNENNKSKVNISNIYDFDYPINSSMIDTINKLIIDSEYRLLFAVQKDNTNNQSNES